MAADATPTSLMRRRMLSGTASNATGQVVSMATYFLLTPFLLSQVGPVGYGLWVLVGSVTAYSTLLDLGIGSAVVKYVAEYRQRGDSATGAAFLATALRLYLALGVVALLLFALLAVIFPDLLSVAPEQRDAATILVLLAGVNVAISIASAPAMSVLVGLHRFGLHNLLSVGGALSWAAASVVVLMAGGGVVEIVALNIPATILVRIASVRAIRRVAPDFPFSYAGGNMAMARSVLGFSAAVFAAQISSLLQRKSDELVIGVMLAVAAVTPYALGRRLSEVSHRLANQFVRVLLPAASELDAAADEERMRRLYIVSTRVTTALFIPIGLAIVLLAEPILQVWVGPGYEDAVPVILVLTLASFLLTTVYPAGAILQGKSRFKWVGVSSLLSGVANLALSLYLVQQLGIFGVAVGTLIPTAIETMAFVMPYTMWVLRVDVGRTLRQAWLPALLPALPAAIALRLLADALQPDSLVMLAACAALGAAVYGAGYLMMPANLLERQALANAVRRTAQAARRAARRSASG